MSAQPTQPALASLPPWLDPAGVRAVHVRPARAGTTTDWPAWVPPTVVRALNERGIDRPWQHQVAAAEAAFAGRSVAVATGTASGKSLAYQLPVLTATHGGEDANGGLGATGLREHLRGRRRPHTALHLSPTKALAHDQLRAVRALDLPALTVSALDGDCSPEERDWARDHASWVFTNPDMLHHSVLPGHDRWDPFLASLRYIVLDEAHAYRGVFGAHVAMVLRRLRRVCAAHGSCPVVIAASATVADPAATVGALVGEPAEDIAVVDEDTSARGVVTTALWGPPPVHHDEATADLLAASVGSGAQTLAFVNSRVMAEKCARRASEATQERVEPYRGGHLPEERRAVEHGLQTAAIRGVATTSALELGIDVAGVDSVIVSGYPGSLSQLWQRVGRAGRRGRDATAVLVARNDPLDAWLCDHPEAIFDAPVERSAVATTNPYVLAAHLAAASQEVPLTEADEEWFGESMTALLDRLVAQGVLRRRPHGWFWTREDRAVDRIDLRSIGGPPVEVIDVDTGRLVGDVQAANADRTVHDGAVYLHRGETWQIETYHPEEYEALARRLDLGWTTQARGHTEFSILDRVAERASGAGHVAVGEVRLSSQVLAYLRRDALTGEVWDSTDLDLPVREWQTRAVWFEPDGTGLGLDRTALRAGMHALEHVLHSLLTAFAPGDRADTGATHDADHPDVGGPVVLVHDHHPGGSGHAETAWARAEEWIAAATERLERCPCEAGCPGCIVSAACGSGNQALDKAAALAIARSLVGHRSSN